MNALDMIRLEIASRLCEIEDLLAEYGVDNLRSITLVAVDASEPVKKHIIVHNGDDDNLVTTAELLDQLLTGAAEEEELL